MCAISAHCTALVTSRRLVQANFITLRVTNFSFPRWSIEKSFAIDGDEDAGMLASERGGTGLAE
jgi:hypothetical protein